MLKPKLLAQVLQQPNTGGVRTTLLLNPDGSLVAFAGETDREAKVVAAVASNVWFAYERHGRPGAGTAGSAAVGGGASGGVGSTADGGSEGLKSLLIDCEHGRLCVTQAGKMLLCLVAEENVEFGLLETKTRGLKEYLQNYLNQITI